MNTLDTKILPREEELLKRVTYNHSCGNNVHEAVQKLETPEAILAFYDEYMGQLRNIRSKTPKITANEEVAKVLVEWFSDEPTIVKRWVDTLREVSSTVGGDIDVSYKRAIGQDSALKMAPITPDSVRYFPDGRVGAPL